jgi:hypothetical protein
VKSPDDLAEQLRRQWQQNAVRERRLLSADAWPLVLPIGMPDSAMFTRDARSLRDHLQRWRDVRVGEVVWAPHTFRDGSEPLDLPRQWGLRSPSEWIEATGDLTIRQTYDRLGRLVAATDPLFHKLLVRHHLALLEKPETAVVQATRLALALSPGCAAGIPLRAVSLAGIDSKFFERHRRLLIQLLDVRFENQASAEGLEVFLDALTEGDHWLLVAPLAPSLLPFSRQRVRSSELSSVALPASHILIVENERCLHQLPVLPDTIAILGAGLHLEWMQASWLADRRIGYWGDLDTWGLKMLAKARGYQPDVNALLMEPEIFERHRVATVEEASPADEQPPPGLTVVEQAFYRYLRGLPKGRLEQEFLPRHLVADELARWHVAGVSD